MAKESAKDAIKDAFKEANKEFTDYIAQLVTEFLKQKHDRVTKTLSSEAAVPAIKAFIAKEQQFLVIYSVSQGSLIAENVFPAKTKGNWLLFYFIGDAAVPANLQYIVLETNPCNNLLFFYDLVSFSQAPTKSPALCRAHGPMKKIHWAMRFDARDQFWLQY